MTRIQNIALDLLSKYEESQELVICEFNATSEALAELKQEVEQYRTSIMEPIE